MIQNHSSGRGQKPVISMKKPLQSIGLFFTTANFCFVLLLLGNVTRAEEQDMVLESLDGDVTTNEYQSFIDKLNYLPPPPTNDIGNLMVDEHDGARIHGLQTFYSFTHDRRVLDKAIVWSDAFLHARNDPVNGRVMWTGKRELCWPNKATNDLDHALYTGAENGDVIEHIVNTARLILENPTVWSLDAPTDTFAFGKTYLDRAKTYVNECQKSAETTIVPWYVHDTKDGYHLIHPDSKVYWDNCQSTGPVPWNQQQELVGALLRLAQCHRLLNDGNTNIAYYEKITEDAAKWFFAKTLPVSAQNRVCYDWAYTATIDPAIWPEVTTESDYDMFIFRAYQANLGPTRTNMQRLINTARFVMYHGTNQFSGQVNGISTRSRYERQYLSFEWIEMSVLDRNLYRMTANAVLTSHEYWDNIAVEAAVLSAKHYWATAQSVPPEIIEDASGLPPVPQTSPSSLRHLPPIAIIGMLWGASEALLNLTRRSKSSTKSRDRNSLRAIWVVNLIAIALGVFISYRFRSWGMPSRELVLHVGIWLFAVGLALRWFSIIWLGRFFTVNVAIAGDHRVIDTGPYRHVRHPSYSGALLAALGLSLCLMNWASLVIVFVPSCAATLWRIHVEETALVDGLGEPYRNYMQRTKRLIPMIY